MDDARGRGVDEGFDGADVDGAREQGARAVHIDLFVEGDVGIVGHGRGRGGVDDDLGPGLAEGGSDCGGRCDVGVVVGHVGNAVARCGEVEDGDGGGVGRRDELLDDVVAEKPAAADDEDVAEGL